MLRAPGVAAEGSPISISFCAVIASACATSSIGCMVGVSIGASTGVTSVGVTATGSVTATGFTSGVAVFNAASCASVFN